jgi:serine phosphatase RsbU (regulator of sigma subunit)
LKHFILIFSALLLISSHSFAKEKPKTEKDYLDIVSSNAPDSTKLFAYFHLSNLTMNSSPLVSRYYAEKCKKLAAKVGNKRYLCEAYISLSVTHRLTGEIKKCIEYINQALILAESINNSTLLADCYHELALISLSQNDKERSLEYNLKSISIHKLNNNLDGLAGEYNNLGITYAQMGNWEEAIKYFRLALAIEDVRKNKYSLGNDYNNIGVFYIVKGTIDSAGYYIQKGLKVREEIHDRLGICGSNNNLALLELEKNNPEKALLYANKALDVCKQIQSVKDFIELYETYYKIYLKKKEYKTALDFYIKKDSLIKKSEFDANAKKLSEMQNNIELEKKEKEILEKDLSIQKAQEISKKKNYLIIFSLSGLAILIGVMFYILRTSRKIKEASGVISAQKKLIEEKHKDITDSINYAQKIQTALIVSEKKLSSRVDNVFVMFRPRDIVSGDFYWYGEKNGFKLLAVADCTGHGVPGAFMSMIGITLLNQIVNEKGIVSPAEILNKLREGIISSLNETGEVSEKRDGMDVALIAWNKLELIYAGANNNAVLVNKNETIELKADKQPVGLYEKQVPFTEQRFAMENIASIYLFTDGIIDQFGGEQGKKVKMRLFKEWLNDIASLDSVKQKEELERRFNKWKGDTEQTDDILVVGIKA